jgi:hypothetical protein
VQAAAEETGTSLDAVVAERWGSLSGLTAGLTEQRAAHGACGRYTHSYHFPTSKYKHTHLLYV